MTSALRRIICMLLVLVMVFAMAACGKPQEEATGTSTTSGNTDPLDIPEGYNRLVIYWDYKGDISTADFWMWFPGAEGRGHLLESCDYGVKVVFDVPDFIKEVGFIARYGCSEPGGSSWGNATKDYDQDRFAVITGNLTEIYIKSGQAQQYSSTDGGKTLTEIVVGVKLNLATMEDFYNITYHFSSKATVASQEEIKLTCNGEPVTFASVSNLNTASTSGNIQLTEKLDITKVYQLEIEGNDPVNVMPLGIFDCQEFLDNYTYDGDDLGAVIHGDQTTFKVWAPTASRVVLSLFDAGNGGNKIDSVEMVLGSNGVWETTYNCGHGTYYTYAVTTAAGTQVAADPYAKAAGVNGDRSMVIDLSLTDPQGWDGSRVVELEKYTDAIIWEVHVRDFSNQITQSQYKGKYLAFTERGLTNAAGVSVGVDYLKQLGVTHIHLLPIYDFASVDETRNDQFNWGYDPENYNVPEGSYSTDPYHGEVRVLEFKQMVQSLHNDGLGVVMDVVYNHTYDANSSLNKIVPYYYYRYTADGKNSSASGCGNDTASERYMFRKFMVDSVTYWAREYKLDGFRFDLMGLHDLETMRQIEQAVHAINPNAILYGEGWTMGSTIDGSLQANQTNIHKIEASEGSAGAVGVFNDAIRDGLKGSVFSDTGAGYINGQYLNNKINVQFGIRGGYGAGPGWQVAGAAIINYMSAHDNHTLWDKLALTNPDATVEERLAMNRMGATILMISRGTPFWQAGEEMLRSKPNVDGTFNNNSYNASDAVNNLNWEALVPGSDAYEMMLYYKGLIEMRKACSLFTSDEATGVSFQDLPGGGMVAIFENDQGERALVLINPTSADDAYVLSGEWKVLSDGVHSGSQISEAVSGTIQVKAGGVVVLYQAA